MPTRKKQNAKLITKAPDEWIDETADDVLLSSYNSLHDVEQLSIDFEEIRRELWPIVESKKSSPVKTAANRIEKNLVDAEDMNYAVGTMLHEIMKIMEKVHPLKRSTKRQASSFHGRKAKRKLMKDRPLAVIKSSKEAKATLGNLVGDLNILMENLDELTKVHRRSPVVSAAKRAQKKLKDVGEITQGISDVIGYGIVEEMYKVM